MRIMGHFRSIAVRGLFLLCAVVATRTSFSLPVTIKPDPPIPSGDVRIHYYRPDGVYTGWALYTWNASTENASWCQSEVAAAPAHDEYGVYFDVSVSSTQGMPPGDLGFILNNCTAGQIKDPGTDQHLDTNTYKQAWIISGDATVYTTEPSAAQKLESVFQKQQAYWMDRSRVAIQPAYFQSGDTYSLLYSGTGSLQPGAKGVTGGQSIPLLPGGTLTQDELTRYPQLANYAVLTVSPDIPVSTLKQALKGQLAVAAVSSAGTLDYATGVQPAGALDDLYFYAGKLGVVVRHSGDALQQDADDDDGSTAVKLKLWAPTAQGVSLLLYDHADDTTPTKTLRMREKNGVWSAKGTADWVGKYYLYSVNVWVPVDKASTLR